MFRFFKSLQKTIISQHNFKVALELSKNGKKEEALAVCKRLVEQYPFDVQFRHRLAKLQLETHHKIDLPDISPRSHNK